MLIYYYIFTKGFIAPYNNSVLFILLYKTYYEYLRNDFEHWARKLFSKSV